MLKEKILVFLFLFIISTTAYPLHEKVVAVDFKSNLYDQLHLADIGLSDAIFKKALVGLNHLKSKCQNKSFNLLTIIDFSQSSNSKRLYVIDLEQKTIVFNTYVAHGRNSGEEFAHSFSNKSNSYQSSLGFYLTDETYIGAHGFSLRLKGVEQNINDGAIDRGIVFHAADYVSESFIKQNGRLGRSQGCPAVSSEMCLPIINAIKGGNCVFMYYPDKVYLKHSQLLSESYK